MRSRIGPARVGGELDAVDDVAAIGRQLHAADASRSAPSAAWRTGRPCGRPSPPAAPRRRSARPPSAAARGRCRGCCRGGTRRSSRRSRRPAAGKPCPRRPRPAVRFRRRASPAKTSGGKALQAALDALQLGLVRVVRHLADRLGSPAFRAPFRGHRRSFPLAHPERGPRIYARRPGNSTEPPRCAGTARKSAPLPADGVPERRGNPC